MFSIVSETCALDSCEERTERHKTKHKSTDDTTNISIPIDMHL